MAFPIAGAIAGGASLIGSLVNSRNTRKTNQANRQLAQQQNEYNVALQDKQFQYDTAASEKEYERNLALWQMNNEYNSPASQVQRYKDAGLNPNLIYGSGTASAGNASAPESYTAARYKSPHAERATNVAPQFNFDPFQAVQAGQMLAQQKATTENINAQASFTEQQTRNNAIDGLLKAEELTGRRLSNREKDELFEPTIMAAHINNRRDSNQADILANTNQKLKYEIQNLQPLEKQKLVYEIENLRISNNLNAFTLQLKKLGIHESDNMLFRLGARLMIAHPNEVKSFINQSAPSRTLLPRVR